MRLTRSAPLILFLLTSSATADYTRGVYGKLEYVLMNDTISDSYNKSVRKSLIQNYQLGYEHYIYSPRLLTYDLGVSFYIDNSRTDVTSSTATSRSENESQHTNYRAYLNFIKKSRYPFTVYYEKIDSPIWSTAADSTTLITYITEKNGLYGRVKVSDTFNINYEYRNSTTDKTESFAFEHGKSNRVSLGASKQFDENLTATLTYSHETRDYYRSDNGLNYTDSWNDTIDTVVGTLSWIISDTLHLTSSANYMSNDYLNYDNMSSTVALNWTPNKKHSETLSVTADFTSTESGSNTYVSLNESGTFRHNERFTTNHNFQLYEATGDLYNMTLLSGTYGANYLKQFSPTFSGSVGASVTGRVETYDYGDENASIQDRNMLSYTLSGGLSKSFEESKSNISANVSFYQLISTTSDSTDRVSANLGYNKSFTPRLSYYLKLYSTIDRNRYTSADNNVTERTTNIFNADNALSYWQPVGYNGKMTMKAGVQYSVGTFADRVNPYGSLSFFYMLRRDLMFKALGRVSSDTAYNVTSYTGTADIIYRLRMIEIKTGIKMSKQTGGTFGNRDHVNYYFKISRKI